MEERNDQDSKSIDLDSLLQQKEMLEGLIRDKFMKPVTVMFTDLKGSTTIAEKEGDLASRMLIRDHNNIVFPKIKDNGGVLVKTMGDGTLSYFESAQGAIRAAAAIQKEISEFNLKKLHKMPILVRIGMHTGNAIIEKNDIFGDVVNTASRFESSAKPGEIYVSESTYEALTDKNEILCRFLKEVSLKGKEGTFSVYKAYWNPAEAAEESSKTEGMPAPPPQPARQGTQKISTQLPEAAQAAPASQATAPSSEEMRIQQKADLLANEGELIQLYLMCEENSAKGLAMQMLQEMVSELKDSGPREIRFFGEEALWFFKTSFTTGRLKEADYPITNLAVSRAPVIISIRGGEGFLKIVPKAAEGVKQVEIERENSSKSIAAANTEYALGKNGRIVFSHCFPVEYKVHKDRFLILKMSAYEDCVRQQMNLSLAEVWKNFASECKRLIILGI